MSFKEAQETEKKEKKMSPLVYCISGYMYLYSVQTLSQMSQKLFTSQFMG